MIALGIPNLAGGVLVMVCGDGVSTIPCVSLSNAVHSLIQYCVYCGFVEFCADLNAPNS